jgi:tRNA 2-thiocytidine biosynthesis protein TtcA
MIEDLERERPGTKAILLAALSNVRPSHLLDRRLWVELGIAAARDASEEVLAIERLVR